MIALVLVHEGLDVSADVELAEPGATGPAGVAGRVRHRGGDRLRVTARADRAALEWALALTDRVTALTVGPPESAGVLAWARARGATEAIRVWDAGLDALDLAAMARVLAAAVGRLAPDILVAGERGLAGATGALPALLAAHLGWPAVTGAGRLGRDGDEVVVERRLGGGRREELAVRCPAVLSVGAGSIEPRYVSLRARRDPAAQGHQVWSLAELGLTAPAVRAGIRLEVLRVDWPRPRARRSAAPPPARSAAERLRQLVAGGAGRAGAAQAPEGPVLEGDPGAIADRILAFLQQRGLA